MSGFTAVTIRAAMRSGKLTASNKSGKWITTRQAVADWLGVDVADVRIPYFAPDETAA